MTVEGMKGWRWAVAAVCGVLSVAGCGDGSSAQPTTPAVASTAAPTPDASPDPTVEPTPVVTDRAGTPIVLPERPAAMDNDDPAGASAAAQYFMAVYGYTIRSQDLTEFNRLCDLESLFCAAIVDLVSKDIAAGNVTVGGSMEFSPTRVDVPGERPFYVVWGGLDRTPFVTYDVGGILVYESDGDSGTSFGIAVEPQGDGEWIVREAEGGVGPPS